MRLLDYWAGRSDLLHRISCEGKPQKLVAFDPVYSQPLEESLASNIAILERAKIGIVMNCWSTPHDSINMVADIDRQITVLRNYKNQNPWIVRIPNAHYLSQWRVEFDRIFVFSVLNYVDSLGDELGFIDSLLSSDGQIYVLDFTHRSGWVFPRFQHAWIPIIKTHNQYFFAILKKWDAQKIQW